MTLAEGLILALAVLALVVAIAALRRAGGFSARIEAAELDVRRRVENAAQTVEQDLALQRRLLARVASGTSISAEMIAEGRLWDDVDPPTAARNIEHLGWRTLDVRTPQETARGVIPGALLIPVDELERRVREIPRDGKALVVYCASGGRSAAACEFLSREGVDDLHNLAGGIHAWTGKTVVPS